MLSALRTALPFGLRVELARLRRLPSWLLERPALAPRRVPREHRGRFEYALAEHRSPLRRCDVSDEVLQRGKEQNVRRAAALLDGLSVAPGALFSYHHAVGRPSRARGFAEGLELRDGAPSKGVGGGCCQVSNLLYWLALCAGATIVERHRHALDLFPDRERTVPFGCGATVFYNYADLRFANPLAEPLLLCLAVRDGQLHGSLRSARPAPWRVEVEEREHRFFQREGAWYRENRVYRRFLREGEAPREELVSHNVGRVLYEPSTVGAEAPCSAR